MFKKIFFGSVSAAVNVIIYILIIIVAVRLVTYAYNFSYDVFSDQAYDESSEDMVTVDIPDGASTEDVGKILEDAGIIESASVFKYHTAFSQYKGLIKPGTYELSPSMTMDEILQVICDIQEEEELEY